MHHLSRAPIARLSLALLALALCSRADAPPPGPQVTRTTRGDTAGVRTEAGSVWGVDATLVAEVSIGDVEGDLDYVFGRISSLGVDADGTIYVVDAQVPDLRAFTPDGRFLRTLGRPGEGPGGDQEPRRRAGRPLRRPDPPPRPRQRPDPGL